MTRELLLEAAREAFAQRGFEGASLDFIVEGTGLTKGAIYSNFGSKEAMFLEVADRHFLEAHDASAAILRGAAKLSDAINALIVRMEAMSVERHRWSQLTVQLQIRAEYDGDFRERYIAFHAEQRRIVGEVVALMFARAGRIPSRAVEDIGDALMAFATGIILQSAATTTGPGIVGEQFRAFLLAQIGPQSESTRTVA